MLWIHAAQTVGILSGSLMSLLIYLLARQAGARFWYALAAAFLWALGPRTSTFGPDGMSDALAICLFTSSLLFAIKAMGFRHYLNARQLGLFACSGFLAGLAYLTRPEGLAAPLFVTFTLVIWWLARLRTKLVLSSPVVNPRNFRPFKLLPRRPLPTATLFASLAALWLAVAVPAAPYAFAIGAVTHKKTLLPPPTAPSAIPNASTTPVPLRKNPILWVWNEVAKTLGNFPTVLLIVAIFWQPRMWGRPRIRLLFILGGIGWLLIMFWLLLSYGYLDGRHTLPLQVLNFAVLGIALRHWQTPVRWVATLWFRRQVPLGRWPSLLSATLSAAMLLAAIIGLRTIPHPENIVITRAATWAQTHLAPEVVICDWHQLVGYYSGHPYARWSGTPLAPDLDSIHNVQAPIILGMFYKDPHDATLRIGNYRAIAAFQSDAQTDNHPLYILYALPDQPVLADAAQSRIPIPLTTLAP